MCLGGLAALGQSERGLGKKKRIDQLPLQGTSRINSIHITYIRCLKINTSPEMYIAGTAAE